LGNCVEAAAAALLRPDLVKWMKVLRAGLWRHTRHPNYSDEAAQRWACYLILASTAWGVETASVLIPRFPRKPKE
ncbi:MAG: DUF1295 domain-containing protein, partial [Anaerolineae bacterium]